MNTRMSQLALGACLSVGFLFAVNASSQLRGTVSKATASKTLKVKSVPIAPSVKQALTGKKAYDEAKVKQKVSYSALMPLLKLVNGRQVKLERVDKTEPQPSAQIKAAAQVLDPSLSTYRAYINAPFVKNQRPVNLTKLVGLIVDHKARQTGIKDQGSRNTCVGFAATAGLESFLKWKYNSTPDLSEQHVFEVFMDGEGNKSCNDQGLQTWKAAQYLTDKLACDNWAYTSAVPECSISVPSSCALAAKYGHKSTQVLFGTAFGGSGTQTANNTNYLESLLQAGNDVIFGIYLAGSDWTTSTLNTGVVDVQMQGTSPAPAFGGHAMLMVGYNRPGNYFEFKNSWGTGAGHAGYVRLSYEYVQAYGKYGYYIKSAAKPLTVAKAGKTPPQAKRRTTVIRKK